MKEATPINKYIIVKEDPDICDGCYIYETYGVNYVHVCDELFGSMNCPGVLKRKKVKKWVQADIDNIKLGMDVRDTYDYRLVGTISYIPKDSPQVVVKYTLDNSEYAYNLCEIEVLAEV